VKAPRVLKSGGSNSVPICYFIKLQKDNFKKDIQSEPIKIMTRRSVVTDEGKMADYIFFDHFQSKLKMQNIFMIMNSKKTYLSWKNLKEECCQAIDIDLVNSLKISHQIFLKLKFCTLTLSPLYVQTHCNLDITISGRISCCMKWVHFSVDHYCCECKQF